METASTQSTQAATQPAVLVLLATFNGERFLRAQIDSILAQTHRPLRILARDDGSTDGTRTILDEYAARLPGDFTVLPTGTPTGSAKLNFLELLRQGREEDKATYFALADQDDLWDPDKVAIELEAMRAIELDNPPGTPALVFSDLRTIDQAGNILAESFWRNQGIHPANAQRLRRLLAQNVVTGCTALLNRPLVRLASRMPPDAYMHDWWLALLAASFGKLDHVARATVGYRQHSGNVLGAVGKPENRLVPKWRYHDQRRAQWEMAAHQAMALERVHGDQMPRPRRQTLELFLRSECSHYRVVRVGCFLLGRFFFNTLRGNLAMLWYLWDMAAAKRSD